MIDALMNPVAFQRLIDKRRPRCPPFLRFAQVVPVGQVDAVVLPAAFAVGDALPALVQVVFLTAFGCPFAVFREGAKREQDVSVNVALLALRVVDGEIL